MSENNLFLGKINPPSHERDAIHIAVIQMIAGRDMRPGSHVFIKPGTTDTVLDRDSAYNKKNLIGIVDPFITAWNIDEGSRVWIYLYPNTINGLRHSWTHPAFSEAERVINDASESERWIRSFAAEWNFDYDELIDAASHAAKREWSYVVAQGFDLHSAHELGEDHDLFWHHLEILTGKVFDEEHRGKLGWSCSC